MESSATLIHDAPSEGPTRKGVLGMLHRGATSMPRSQVEAQEVLCTGVPESTTKPAAILLSSNFQPMPTEANPPSLPERTTWWTVSPAVPGSVWKESPGSSAFRDCPRSTWFQE